MRTCWLLLALLAAPSWGAPPLNLVLITLDTVRADRLGAWGGPSSTTPALDRFAHGSAVFQAAYCPITTTIPSHVSLFAGIAPPQHGVWHNGMQVPSGLPSIFPLLEAGGRRIGAVVGAKMLAGTRFEQLGLPAAPWSAPEAERSGEDVTNDAIAWLAGRRGRPFALWVHYFDAHEPYAPSANSTAHFTGGYAGPLPNRLSVPFLVSLATAQGPHLAPADANHVLALYDAELHDLDRALGRLLDYLRRRGLLETTVVVVVGDHGQAHGEEGYWGHGERLLEPVVRVPLLVHHPRKRARTIDHPVSTLDLAPTLATLLGLPRDPAWQGRSLVGLWAGRPLPPHPIVVHRRRWDSQPERRGVLVRDGAASLRVEVDADETLRLETADGARLEPVAQVALAASAAVTSPDHELRAILESLGYTN